VGSSGLPSTHAKPREEYKELEKVRGPSARGFFSEHKKSMITLGDVHAAPEIDREAMKIMSQTGNGRIPVKEGGKLVGIVTRTDIMTTLEIKEA